LPGQSSAEESYFPFRHGNILLAQRETGRRGLRAPHKYSAQRDLSRVSAQCGDGYVTATRHELFKSLETKRDQKQVTERLRAGVSPQYRVVYKNLNMVRNLAKSVYHLFARPVTLVGVRPERTGDGPDICELRHVAEGLLSSKHFSTHRPRRANAA
jgi:hypothetical protein